MSKELPKDLNTYLKEYLPKRLEELNIVGASVGIVQGGQAIFQSGYGYRDLENKLPVDAETIFAIGSTSKAITATVLGTLVDEGKLKWDDLVSDYIPELRLKDPVANAQLNIKDIMCHRCGLPRHDLACYLFQHNRSELVEKIRYFEPFAPFRSAFYYNNWMWMLAGVVGEKITGKSWEDNVRERIFEPLGMKTSNFSVDVMQNTSNYSQPYALKNNKMVRIPFRNIDAIGPAGSINAPMQDYVKWLMLNLNGGEYGTRVISKKNLEVIYAPLMVIDKENDLIRYFNFDRLQISSIPLYALGWMRFDFRGNPIILHGGGIDGFSAAISFMPDAGLGVAILTNSDGISTHYGLSFEIYDYLLGQEPKNWSERCAENDQSSQLEGEQAEKALLASQVKDTKPSHELSAYCGDYQHPAYGKICIQQSGEELGGDYGGIAVKISHFHYDAFLFHLEMAHPDVTLPGRFISGLAGKVEKLLLPLEARVAEIEFQRIS